MNDILLAIDSSTLRLQLGLSIGEKTDILCVDIAKKGKKLGHGEILFAQIEKLLKRNEISYQDLTKICVISGPGSFTGLRIGIAAVRSFFLALKVDVVGIPTLLALSLKEKDKTDFNIIIDARRDEVFSQSFFKAGKAKADPILMDKKDGLVISESNIDMEILVQFALKAKPEDFPVMPCYIRKADAKISTKANIVQIKR